jgi:hypothetical protein
MPVVAIVGQGMDFELAVEIERRVEPEDIHALCRRRFGVPALMPPNIAARRLLPAVAKRAVARRKNLQVAVLMALCERLAQLCILGFTK